MIEGTDLFFELRFVKRDDLGDIGHRVLGKSSFIGREKHIARRLGEFQVG